MAPFQVSSQGMCEFVDAHEHVHQGIKARRDPFQSSRCAAKRFKNQQGGGVQQQDGFVRELSRAGWRDGYLIPQNQSI
eukprot:4703562-Amphidinium_carterae.1